MANIYPLLVLTVMLSITCSTYSQQVSTTRLPQRTVTIPPLIIQDPPKVMAFREYESIEMPCVADGEPEPTYKWQMNHKDFDPSGLDGRVAIQPGVGTLIFARPLERDEGIYQCFANNQVGTAITVMVDLRQAILEPFQASSTNQHRTQLGHPLTLRCIPPRSFPQPDIFWATIAAGEQFSPIDLTDRITIDPEGNLHFAHVLPEDGQSGRTYACIVQNKVMRSIQQGEYAQISPQGQTIQNMAPTILWMSPTQQVTLRGRTWRVKCIFSGSPTPRVDWVRLDKDMPDRARLESFGMELVIDYVEFEDAGKYECQGINSEAQVPIRRSFDLSIESAPYWVSKPTSVDAAENEAAVFHCEASGIPEPINFWFLNGVPISNVPADPRRVVEKTKLTFFNMTKEDAQVVQCNSTNKHATIFTNAYLNVLSEPATIVTAPLIDQKAAEGQTINLTCEVFGSPKPLVVWKKSNEQLTGGRFKVQENGNLEITDVSLVDAGSYECIATNVFGTDSAVGSLIVRRKTTIETKPLDVMVYEGTEAKFTCTAATDPEEVAGLMIDWKKDGQFIDYQLAQRVFKNDMDNSLTISGTISLDTGKYTCVARNGLDEDEWAAQLIVQGVPDPPNNVRVLCTNNERQAEVTWQPGRENYAPILNFIIQFNTTFTPDTWIDIETNVSQSDRRKVVTLSPYGNYTFRVIARNKIGMSQPSQHTEDVCRTEPGRPVKNPENVIGEGDLPNNLVIFWTPMPKIEQNSQGFKYIITWKRADQADAEEENWQVDLPEAWHYVVWEKFDKPYIPFYITVKAANAIGQATVAPKTIMGYSGEDEPEIYPTDVTFVEDSVKSTDATLKWTPIDEDVDKIHGFFRGYRIQFAKADEWPENIREQDLILNDPLYYPRPRIQRKKRQADEEEEDPVVTVLLMNLPPHSTVRVQVRVLNKYYAGPASEPIEFNTDEGVPGPPAMFDVLARGSTHFELQWEKPYEPNGVLVGYNISYQTITGLNLGRLQYREPIEDAEADRARLTGLQPDSYYRVYLHAATSRGKGEPIFLDMKTTPAGPPSAPTFDVVGLNETWVNITWEPSRSGNPGSVFYVQYRPRADYEWLHSPDEVIRYHMEIFDLNPGTTYQIRVISKNGAGEEAPGEWLEFHTQGVAPGRYNLGISGWFYGIWVVLLLLIIFLVLFIVLKMKRDKWWQEKENEIQDQVRQLQAEDAARQMGVFNQYADTGSREYIDPSMSYHSDYHKGAPVSDDDEEEEDYSEEEEEQYKPPVPQYNSGQPTYNVYAQQQPDAYQPQQPGYQVGYQQPQQLQLDPSAEKPDTFV